MIASTQVKVTVRQQQKPVASKQYLRLHYYWVVAVMMWLSVALTGMTPGL